MRLVRFFLKPAIGLACIYAVHVLAREVATLPARCGQPCRWDPREEYAHCQPLSLKLEIATNQHPQTGHTVEWYRVTVNNSSCDTLNFYTETFSGNDPIGSSSDTIRLKVFDAAGRALTPVEDRPGQSGIDDFFTEIHPYRPDESQWESLIKMNLFRYGSFRAIALPPGATITTVGEVLAPFQMALSDERAESHVYTSIGNRLLDSPEVKKQFPAPPPGFRSLRGLGTPPKGKYSAIATFTGEVEVGRRRAIDAFPTWIRKTLSVMAWESDWKRPIRETINSTSERVMFEVKS